MTDQPVPDVTSQILIQIRDEMRAMRASFETRFDAIEARFDGLESHMQGFEARMDAFEARMEAFDARMEAFEARLDSFEDKNEVHHQELFRRFGIVDSDLKRFAGIANEAILHYADEMDSVRDRVVSIERKLDIAPASD